MGVTPFYIFQFDGTVDEMMVKNVRLKYNNYQKMINLFISNTNLHKLPMDGTGVIFFMKTKLNKNLIGICGYLPFA